MWTVLEDPIRDLYDLPEWEGVELEWLAGEPLDSPVGVGVSIENFRDVAHFPIVHKASMGPTPEVVEPLHVQRDGLDVWMDRPLDAGSREWAGDGNCMMRYLCAATGFASITYHYDQLGRRVVAGFPSPIDYEHVVIFWGVANKVGYKGASLEEKTAHRGDRVSRGPARRHMVEPKEIPWDAEVQEFSVPADMFTLNYRRSFVELMNRVKDGVRVHG